ncbi:MAG: MarR family transcriptional regulator [Gammaproteobacteria bacterium]|nr:MarR family transcriptional regulator [Gammaproteobacteria bacterium]MAY02559.1 MarR family transcriptional regulator [Gammaproteobacteria bacterium]|tara:strand:- start:7515 stop:7964 length:450 start_codon:yes stop_codon:yes gene_type:complete
MQTMKNKPSETFGFILNDIARLLRWEFDRQAQHLGLTRAQWSVLAHLRHYEGVQQKELANFMDIKPITLTRHLDNLERREWVERRDDPDDRRAKRIFLSTKAKPMIISLTGIGKKIRTHALRGLSTDEQTQLMQMLNKIRGNLNENERN